MKKIITLITAVLLISALAVTSNAASWMIKENPTIEVPQATPTIDGNINSSEGWSTVAYLNEETATGAYLQNPLTSTVEFYFAFDDNGLYFAAEYKEVGAAYRVRFYNSEGSTDHEATYTDANAGTYTFEPGGYPSTTPDGYAINYYKIDANTTSAPAGTNPDTCFWDIFSGNGFAYCTGEDDIDEYAGWNGDVIGINFDFLSEYDNEQFNDNGDHTTLYNFGLFEDGSVRVARSYFDNGEITEECQTAGHKTDSGFCFEAMIPWSTLVDDANSCAVQNGLEHTYTVDEVKTIGTVHRASVVLQDRFYDTEAEAVDTWGRFITVCETTSYGMAGYSTSANNVGSYGLHLQIGKTGSNEDTGNNGNNNGNNSGNGSSTGNGSAVTTASAQTGKNSTSGSSSQTFDAGVAVALGAVAVSGIGIFSVSKKKK